MSAQPEHEIETVLVVGDEVLIRTALAAYLRDCGYRVLEAVSADEAVSILQDSEFNIDIVFSDIEMPGKLDGFGLAKWVRENAPQVHIVLAGTPAKAAEVAGDICEQGPHLAKPYEHQQVLEWIKRLKGSTPK